LPSLTANFFDMGGHSMAAITAVRSINQRFGLDLPPTALFDMPTAEKLAAAIVAARGGIKVEPSFESAPLTPEEAEQVEAVIAAVRSARPIEGSAFRGMRESLLCKYLLGPLYVASGRAMREILKKLI